MQEILTPERLRKWLNNQEARQFNMSSNRRCIIAEYLRQLTDADISVGVAEFSVNGKNMVFEKWVQNFITNCIHVSVLHGCFITKEDAIKVLDRIVRE